MKKKSRRLRSPIGWFGGKGGMVAKLLPFIPSHRVYVEAFGGGASLLLRHNPSAIEVYNDLNTGLVNFFRVLRNPEQFKQLHVLAQLTPYAREEFTECKQSWATTDDPVERAYRWFLVARMSFSGVFGQSWSYSLTGSNRGMASSVSKWLSTIELLPEISERLLRVQIEHRDAFDVIKCYDSPETFFYLDPPYVHSTRRAGGYEHELSDEAHLNLVGLLQSLKGKALLSGYANPIYAELERCGWKRHDWKVACQAAGKTRATGILGKGSANRTQMRTESIWFNYELDSNNELALAP